MRALTVLVGVLALGVAAADAAAQAPPNFSGSWTASGGRGGAGRGGGGRAGGGAPAADLASGWGPEITIIQQGGTLTVERVIFSSGDLQPPLKFRYALDGSTSTNTVMLGRGMQEDASTATWQGERLVITTVTTVPSPEDGRPVPAEVTRTLFLQPPPGSSPSRPASLVVETFRSGVFGGPPSTTRTVYTRG